MVLQVNKFFIIMVFLALFSVHVLAKESELVLAINSDNKVFAEKLFDDDGKIGLVDVCVLTLSGSLVGSTIPTLSECHQFENVIEGQVLNIDFDGELVGAALSAQQAVQAIQKVSLAVQNLLCGNATCDAGETCSNCPSDCGICPPPTPVCGDTVCNGVETCSSCAQDCGRCFCGNATCDAGETCVSCPIDCQTCTTTQGAVYYNFADFDGQVTSAKFLVFASPPLFAPALSDTSITKTGNIIIAKSLTPRLSADKKSFEVQARVTLNPGISPTSVNYLWRINDGTALSSQAMVKEGNEWVATIGSFNKPLGLKSSVSVDTGTALHTEIFPPRLLYHIFPNEAGTCTSAVFSAPQNTNPKALSSTGSSAFLQQFLKQPGWPETISRLRISPSVSDFRVSKIRDETTGSLTDTTSAPTDDIDFLNIFVVENGVGTPFSFQSVHENQILPIGTTGTLAGLENDASLTTNLAGVNVPAGGPIEIFYNFMDSDDLVGNMNLLLPLNKSDIVDSPFLLPTDKASFINNSKIEIIPSPDCTTFTLKFKTTIPTDTLVDRVYLKYGFGGYSLREESTNHLLSGTTAFPKSQKNLPDGELVLELQGQGNVFEGVLGPFSSGFDFFSRIYAQGSGGESSSWQNFFSWFGISPPDPSELSKPEVCGNNVDDDLDGSVDEGCVVLPDLLFVGESNIPKFVTVGEPISVFATVKNAGVSNTAGFQVSFLINEQLVDTIEFEGLNAQQEARVEFLVPDSTAFLGANKAKIIIDPAGSVPELDRANNEIEQGLGVGFNSLNVILNFNNTGLAGDQREFRAFNSEFGLPESNVKALVKFPSGKTQLLLTNERGINSFTLSETGIYFLTASKDRFETFEALFTVPKISVLNLLQRYELGKLVAFSVQTDDGQKVSDAVVEIKDPNNQITTVKLDGSANGEFLTRVGGPHEITVSRNGVRVFSGSFLAAGLIESIFVSGGAEEILFGTIVRDTPLFLVMLVLSVSAAVLAFSRSRLLFSPWPKSTRQEQLENFVRIIIAVVFFLLPFQASRIGFNAGLIVVIVEAFSSLLFEYYVKRIKRRQPAIKV